MARIRWLSRISRDLLGGTWADVFESYYEVKDLYYSMSEIAKKHMPVASGTCIELAYRQVGQYKFDPEKHMHTPVNLHITAADLPELARIIPRLS